MYNFATAKLYIMQLRTAGCLLSWSRVEFFVEQLTGIWESDLKRAVPCSSILRRRRRDAKTLRDAPLAHGGWRGTDCLVRSLESRQVKEKVQRAPAVGSSGEGYTSTPEQCRKC